jgi:hypothetical protein
VEGKERLWAAGGKGGGREGKGVGRRWCVHDHVGIRNKGFRSSVLPELLHLHADPQLVATCGWVTSVASIV